MLEVGFVNGQGTGSGELGNEQQHPFLSRPHPQLFRKQMGPAVTRLLTLFSLWFILDRNRIIGR